MNGKDHASARYIFTRLEKITRAIFHPDDDALLKYLNDDGLSIEPEYYMPVIPLVLVNGTEGIGTGYSSSVPSHDPREVIANLRKMINGEDPEMIHPCYYGFTGDIMIENTEGKYRITGKVERKDDTTLIISELPIGKSTQDYKTFLEEMMAGTDKAPSEISDFKEHHTDTSVSFTITASEENIDEFEKVKDGLVGKFKLSKALSSTNMTLFDANGKIQKYSTSVDILRCFFYHRLEFYVKRKDMLLEKMKRELKILSNKERFIEEVCEGDLVVSNRKRTELLSELSEKGYDLFPKDDTKSEGEEDDEDETMEEISSDAELAKGYEYLLGLKLWTLTFERAEDIRRQKLDKEAEVSALESTTPESIWLSDLDELDTALAERNKSIETKKAIRVNKRSAKQTKTKSVAKKSTKPKKKAEVDEWNSELEQSDSDGAGSDSEDDFELDASPPKKLKSTNKAKTPTSKLPSLRLSANGKQKIAVLGTRTQQRKSSASEAKAAVTEMLMDSQSDIDESPKKKPAKKTATRRKKSSIVKQALQAEVDLADSDESSTPKKMPARKKLPLSKSKYFGESDSESIEAPLMDSDCDADASPKKMPAKKTATRRKKSSIVKQAIQAEVDLADSDESSTPKKMPARKKLPLSKSKYLGESDSKSIEAPKPKKNRKSICHFSSDESDGCESPYDDIELSADKPVSFDGRKRLSKPKWTFEDSDEDDFEF